MLPLARSNGALSLPTRPPPRPSTRLQPRPRTRLCFAGLAPSRRPSESRRRVHAQVGAHHVDASQNRPATTSTADTARLWPASAHRATILLVSLPHLSISHASRPIITSPLPLSPSIHSHITPRPAPYTSHASLRLFVPSTSMPAYCHEHCHYFYRTALRLLSISTSISPLYA
jgi:hypothetical protein